MVPKQHIVLGFIFSIILFFIFPKFGFFEAFLVFLASFLIDLDHYIFYVFKKKNFNPKKAVRWFFKKIDLQKKISSNKRKDYYTGFYFLHGFESLVVTFILGIFVSKLFFMVFIGFVFHLALDYIEQIHNKKRVDKISSIYDFIKFKKLKLIE